MFHTLLLKKKKVQSQFQPGVTLFLFISISLFLFARCGNGKSDINSDAPPGMQAVDLSDYGIPILINVPEVTTSPLEITENPQGGIDMMVDENIQMTIVEGEGNMALKKNDITQDDVRRFIKYVIEEPDAIVWEWQIEEIEPEFHFYTIIKAGDKSFEVRDTEGKMFSEKSAIQMLDIAKSIRLNETGKGGS